jgi:hypothetical protein
LAGPNLETTPISGVSATWSAWRFPTKLINEKLEHGQNYTTGVVHFGKELRLNKTRMDNFAAGKRFTATKMTRALIFIGVQ